MFSYNELLLIYAHAVLRGDKRVEFKGRVIDIKVVKRLVEFIELTCLAKNIDKSLEVFMLKDNENLICEAFFAVKPSLN